jgi:hypothetical protein
MTHGELVDRAAKWLRNSAQIPAGYQCRGKDVIAKKACGVVLTEYASSGLEHPDAIGWCNAGGTSILVECKSSRADFLADRRKSFRREQASDFALGNFRFYMAPLELLKVEEIPSKWGLLEVSGKRVLVSKMAERVESYARRELALLWSECRKIQIVEQGGALLPTKHGLRVMAALHPDSTVIRSQFTTPSTS